MQHGNGITATDLESDEWKLFHDFELSTFYNYCYVLLGTIYVSLTTNGFMYLCVAWLLFFMPSFATTIFKYVLT